ncbi:MAG: TIGR03118 family protein, partial [Terracidiphilus sp.]
GTPLTYLGLWELLPGGTTVGGTTSVSGGDPSTVYFTAGLAGEAHGLFAGIANSTTATGTPTYGFSAATSTLSVADGASVTTTVSVAPTYNFTGTVSLACSGLPFGTSCSFSPAQISASGTAPGISTLTIQTRGSAAALLQHTGHGAAGIAAALLLPFASVLLVFYRLRLPALRGRLGLLVLCGFTVAAAAVLMGCRPMAPSGPPVPITPTGTSQVTVTATSGSISRTATIALTVTVQ